MSNKNHITEPIRDKQDIWRIIDHFNSKGKQKYAVLFELGCYTGLRASDLLKLKVSDVYNQSQVYLREKKTGKYKSFSLQPHLQDLLNDFCKGRNINEPLFISNTSKPILRIVFYKALVNACKKLNINANIGSHSCRKTFGYHHYKQFKDISLLQKILNHYSPDVTMRYIGITQDEINKSYLQLNLYPRQDEVKQAKLSPRVLNRRVYSFINNYLKNGGTKHKDFCLILLGLLNISNFML